MTAAGISVDIADVTAAYEEILVGQCREIAMLKATVAKLLRDRDQPGEPAVDLHPAG